MNPLPVWLEILAMVTGPLFAAGVTLGVTRSTISTLKAAVGGLTAHIERLQPLVVIVDRLERRMEGHEQLGERVTSHAQLLETHKQEIERARDRLHSLANDVAGIRARLEVEGRVSRRKEEVA